jgi:endonuclease/exonuclease/phosphatase family metal-dependent hydrolase
MFVLSVATINIRSRTQRWLSRRHLLVGELVDLTPDIIALQEISLGIGQGNWLARQVNFRLTGDSRSPYRIVQARRQHPGHLLEAVGVLTSLPIVFHDSLSLGYEGRVALRVNVEIPAERSGMRHQSLDFVSLQLHHTPGDDDARLEQVMNLVGWLNEKRRNTLQVLAGDFNDKPDSPAIGFMRQSYRSAFVEYFGRDPLATYPTNLIQPPLGWSACLDYVFISPPVYKVSKARMFGDKPALDDETLYPSDHVGLLVSLEV